MHTFLHLSKSRIIRAKCNTEKFEIDYLYTTQLKAAAAAAKSLQSCSTLCYPIDGSPPGSPVPGIFQARLLEWVAFPSPMHESEKRSRSVAQSCPTLSDPMDCSLPGCSNHGLFKARVLEWGAIAFSAAKS